MYSDAHKKYIKKRKREKIFVLITQIFIIIFLIALWQILADLKVINTFISSSPKEIVSTLISLHNSNNLYHHIWITIYETLISFGLGTIIGIVIATIMWWNKFISKVLDPYLTILNSLPKVALGPIIIIWVGANMNSIIFMALLISVVITIINVYNGFIAADPLKIKLLKSFKATKRQIFTKVVFPSSIASIMSSLKVNISMSLIGLLPPVGENFIV